MLVNVKVPLSIPDQPKSRNTRNFTGNVAFFVTAFCILKQLGKQYEYFLQSNIIYGKYFIVFFKLGLRVALVRGWISHDEMIRYISPIFFILESSNYLLNPKGLAEDPS